MAQGTDPTYPIPAEENISEKGTGKGIWQVVVCHGELAQLTLSLETKTLHRSGERDGVGWGGVDDRCIADS